MHDQIRILGILNIVLGGMGVLGAIVVLVIFGLAAGVVAGIPNNEAPTGEIASLVGVIGALIAGLVAVVSVPGIIAGVGLMRFRPWARMFAIVISAINLLHFPLGTALGIYGLIVLTKPEVVAIFEQGGVPSPAA